MPLMRGEPSRRRVARVQCFRMPKERRTWAAKAGSAAATSFHQAIWPSCRVALGEDATGTPCLTTRKGAFGVGAYLQPSIGPSAGEWLFARLHTGPFPGGCAEVDALGRGTPRPYWALQMIAARMASTPTRTMIEPVVAEIPTWALATVP